MTLHQRLSDATEGTRELDALVARRLAGDPKDHWFDLHGVWSSDATVPAYTTSLDAALALAERVLPDMAWTVCRLEDGHGFAVNGPYYAVLEFSDEWKPICEASAATPALALCLAILSAKASDTGVGG